MPALLLILLLVAGLSHAEPIDWGNVDPADHVHDRWYLDTVESKPAGYWRASLSVEDDRLVSIYHEYSVETHGGELSTYEHRVVWTETHDFKPITIVTTTSAGSDEVVKTYRFLKDSIELTSEQNGKKITRKLPPIRGDYLTAAQATITGDLMMKRGVESFNLDTLDVSVGLAPFVTTYKRSKQPAETITLADGSETKAQRWQTTYSIFPGFEMEEWIDASNITVGVAYEIDAIKFESRLADATVTETEFDPPELAGLSVVVPDKAIKDVGRKKKIVYELSYGSGKSDVLPVATAQQSVERLEKGRARVTIDLNAKPRPAQDDLPADKHLASSIMIDHQDEVVRRLAEQAVAKLKIDASAEQLAKACKRFVTRHINGASLSVGDGSASEAARTREGDCTECAVLLAALLRANGIPSRCVNGLVYSEDDFAGQKDVFVYHMWTQAWIALDNDDKPGEDGQQAGYWLDLDSAMWRYSAGHIALGVSAMGDGDQQDQIDVVPMQHDLQIKVIQTK